MIGIIIFEVCMFTFLGLVRLRFQQQQKMPRAPREIRPATMSDDSTDSSQSAEPQAKKRKPTYLIRKVRAAPSCVQTLC